MAKGISPLLIGEYADDLNASTVVIVDTTGPVACHKCKRVIGDTSMAQKYHGRWYHKSCLSDKILRGGKNGKKR